MTGNTIACVFLSALLLGFCLTSPNVYRENLTWHFRFKYCQFVRAALVSETSVVKTPRPVSVVASCMTDYQLTKFINDPRLIHLSLSATRESPPQSFAESDDALPYEVR